MYKCIIRDGVGDTHNTVDCGANKYTKTEITATRINLFRGVTHNDVEKVQMEMVTLGERSGQS